MNSFYSTMHATVSRVRGGDPVGNRWLHTQDRITSWTHLEATQHLPYVASKDMLFKHYGERAVKWVPPRNHLHLRMHLRVLNRKAEVSQCTWRVVQHAVGSVPLFEHLV